RCQPFGFGNGELALGDPTRNRIELAKLLTVRARIDLCRQPHKLPGRSTWIRCMNNFGLILRNIVPFLFSVPFLIGFAMEHSRGSAAWVACIALVVLGLAVVAAGWIATRRGR